MTNERNIQDILAEVAELAEESGDKATKMYRSKQPPTDASQVYSIRIPVSRLEDIRKLAIQYGMPPTSMLRSWILERLDLEEEPTRSQRPTISPITHAAFEDFTVVRMQPVPFAAHDAEPSRSSLEHKLRVRQSERHRRMAEV